MGISQIVEDNLIAVFDGANKQARKYLEECADKGKSRSSIAVEGSINVFSDELRVRFNTSISTLKNINLGSSLNKIEKLFINSVDVEYDKFLSKSFDSDNERYITLVNEKKVEIKAYIQLEIQILNEIKSRRKKVFWWDVIKILVSALIGSFIGSYFS